MDSERSCGGRLPAAGGITGAGTRIAFIAPLLPRNFSAACAVMTAVAWLNCLSASAVIHRPPEKPTTMAPAQAAKVNGPEGETAPSGGSPFMTRTALASGPYRPYEMRAAVAP